MAFSSKTLIAVLFIATPLAAQQPPAPAVITASATLIEVSESVLFNGRLVADQNVELRARVSGTLLEQLFSPGDMVSEGDVLFRIEKTTYVADVQEAEGALLSAQSELKLAELERDRQKILVSRQASAQTTLDQAQATLGQASGSLARTNAALDRALLNLSYTDVIAPFSGRIGVSQVDVGALVSLESGTLAMLTKLDPIHAEFSVPTAAMRDHFDRVAAGTSSNDASVSLTLANGTVYGKLGSIDFVDSIVNSATDSVNLRAIFANPDGVLLDSELVRVVLTAGAPTSVLTIPQRAVQRDLQGAFVFVVTAENKVELRRVDADRIVDGNSIILSGLSEGENVITGGMNKVRPGITVDGAPAVDG